MLKLRFWAFNRNKRAVAALESQPLHSNSNFMFLALPLFLRSSIHWSSRSRPSLHNYHLRKRRKWPLAPYKTKWHQTFAHQQAMQTLRESAKTTSKTNLLPALLHSFNIYDCRPSPDAYHFIIKTLTKNPSTTGEWDHITQVLDHLEKVAVFETPECIFIDLIKSYAYSNMIPHAVDLFFRIPNFRCNPSVDSLNALLCVICNQTNKTFCLDIVPQILIKSQSMNIRLENSTFDVLVRALCGLGKVNYAVELLNYATSDGYNLDGRIFSLILRTMCGDQVCNGVDILGFFEDFKKLGFVPDKADWCNIIRFMVNRGGAMEAMAVLNQMRREGMQPNIVCFNWVLDGLVMAEEYTKADELFDQMLVLGLVPDIFTYNTYINGLCKQNNVEKGTKMLSCMELLGCRPNMASYNTILGACCRDGKMILARSVIRKMEVKGVKLNLQTHECMINGCCNSNHIGEACGLLREMVDELSLSPFVCCAFDQILCDLCQRGLFDKGLELLNEMVCKNVIPGRRAWEALLQVHANACIFELDSIAAD